MSDTTETETETETETNTDTTDEPSKAELHDRVQQLESTVAKMMPSRRDALKLGAAGIAGAAGLSATTQPAAAATGSAGQIGDSSNRPDLFADEIDANTLTGSVKNQGCRVKMSGAQSISRSSPTKINFGAKDYDSDNNFDLTTNEWTCPADGLYLVNLQVQLQNGSPGDLRRISVGNSGSRTTFGEGSTTTTTASTGNVRFQTLTVNQYAQGNAIAGYAENTDSSDEIGTGGNNFSTFMEVAFLGGL